jgi:hypothetical protein
VKERTRYIEMQMKESQLLNENTAKWKAGVLLIYFKGAFGEKGETGGKTTFAVGYARR